MDPLDLAILALRLALVLILYAFLVVVLRIARREVEGTAREGSSWHADQPGAPRRRTTALEPMLPLIVLEAGQTGRPAGETIPVPSGAVLGRGGGSSVVLRDPTVSAEHAQVSLADGTWIVRDLGSTNGTTLNERPVEGTAPLAQADVLRLGNVQLKVGRLDR